MSHILKQNSTKNQVLMRLDDEDEDSGDSLQLVPGTSGNNVPSTCTIVIIAGLNIKMKQYHQYLFIFHSRQVSSKSGQGDDPGGQDH